MAKTKEHWNKIDPEKRNTKNLDYYMRTVVPARPGDERPRDGPEHDLALSSHFDGRHTVVVKSRPLNPLLLILYSECIRFLILSLSVRVYVRRACVRVCVGGGWSRLLLLLLSKSSSLFRVASSFPVVFF